LAACALTACALHAVPAAAACEDVAKLSLPGTTVDMATMVPAGGFTPPNATAQPAQYAKLPAFCRVALSLRPTSDSDIKVEVWLPAAGWNGKYQAVGQGGLAGNIPYGDLAEGIAAGYATAGTDTGHVGNNANFMPGHPEKLVDFAYRAVHEMAEKGKAVVNAHYGKPPSRSYFNGCSGGGRHGLTSAQRYPNDFDGIVAGASSWNQARMDAARIGVTLMVNRAPGTRIPESKYPMIHEAVLKACDGLDGVTDGVLENPTRCNFDFNSLLCKGADGPTCLTAAQVETTKILLSPLKDPATGHVLYAGHLFPGAELNWDTLGGERPLPNSLARVRNFHLKDPKWEFRLENIAADVERAAKMDGGLVGSYNFDLRPYFNRGGKLIIFHGWSDPQVPVMNSILYYENVLKTVGPQAANSMTMFLFPGMEHCDGGPGPDTWDKMTAIDQWVEQGRKPTHVIASKVTDGKVVRTRPVCAFGQVAKYDGSGSTDDAANFACVAETMNTAR
jgi:feruloyl esterase